MKHSFGSAVARLVAAGASVLILCSLVSCSGSSGPQAYDLSGTVTFDGKPVGSGRITLVPDQQKGNPGPAGYAEIVAGKFDTRQSGRGTVGGPHTVQIDGYSDEMETSYDEDAEEEVTRAKVLFRGYEQSADLPTSRSTMDFDVPATAARPGR